MGKRIVNYAQLHDGFFVPGGAGQFDKTLPAQNKSLKNFRMTYVEETGALILEWDGGTVGPNRLAAGAFVVGAANIKVAGLGPVIQEEHTPLKDTIVAALKETLLPFMATMTASKPKIEPKKAEPKAE